MEKLNILTLFNKGYKEKNDSYRNVRTETTHEGVSNDVLVQENMVYLLV